MDNILEKDIDLSNHRKSLYYVFWIHIVMFLVVAFSAYISYSNALLADALDFIGDAASYLLSIYAMSRGVFFRVFASITRSVIMVAFGVPVLIHAIADAGSSAVPNYEIMNMMGFLGIIAHIICLHLLLNFRHGDSNLYSVWICTINDLISNIIIVISSFIVAKTNSITPDIIAAIIIVTIALYGAFAIFHRALRELNLYKRNYIYESNTNSDC